MHLAAFEDSLILCGHLPPYLLDMSVYLSHVHHNLAPYPLATHVNLTLVVSCWNLKIQGQSLEMVSYFYKQI